MKLMLNRLKVATKRSLLSPLMYVMVIMTVFLMLLQLFIPEKQKSAYIPIAILNYDESPETIEAIEELCNMNSVFEFYEVDSEEEMYQQMASGDVATGYIIPEDFFIRSRKPTRSLKIKIISTPAAGALSSLATEELFSKLFRRSGRLLTEQIFEEEGLIRSDADRQLLDQIYDEKTNSSEIFAMHGLEGNVYNDETRTEKVDIPIYKFAGLFIYTAALMGILAFLNDYDNKIYLRLKVFEKIYMILIQIGVYIVPMTLVSIASFLVTHTSFNLWWVIAYMFIVLGMSILIGIAFALLPVRTSKSGMFAAMLPVYLILCFLFSGVLFDLVSYSPLFKNLSIIFPPSFF